MARRRRRNAGRKARRPGPARARGVRIAVSWPAVVTAAGVVVNLARLLWDVTRG